MCAFCRKGWHERYPVESTFNNRTYMELGVEWDEGRDMLEFGIIGGGVRAVQGTLLPDVRRGIEG